jgi:hypothetical protein
MLRAPARNAAPGPFAVRPALRVSVKFFGRHKGGALRDGVVRGVGIAEDASFDHLIGAPHQR